MRFAAATVLAAVSIAAIAQTNAPHLKLAPAASPQSLHLRAASASPVPIGHSEFDGTLDGQRPLHLAVDATADGKIACAYTIAGSGQPIAFSGRAINATSFSATVSASSAGAAIAPYLYAELARPNTTQLTGSFYGDGESNLHYIVLNLTSTGEAPDPEADPKAGTEAATSAPPALAPAEAASIAERVQQFLAAVSTGQPAEAAKYIAFPLAYTANGRRALLHTAADFQKKFAAVFSPAYLDQLKYVKPTELHTSGDSVVLGDNLLLLDPSGKVFALNNEHVRMFAARKFLSNQGWSRTNTGKANGASGQPAASKP